MTGVGSHAEQDRPNVLLIMADQWRGDCLSAAGHPSVRTPFLDRLGSHGARFDRAYSATPTCIPARASLMTGLRPVHHGRVGYLDGVPWDYPVTLPGEFTSHGYQTQGVGKMHFFPERSQLGFQNVILHSPTGIVRQARQQGKDPDRVDDYLPWLRSQLGRDASFVDHGIDSNSWVARPWDKPEHTHPTNFVAGQAATFLRRRDPRKPFFLFASFNAPHPPYDPPRWALEQYLDIDRPDPPVGDWADLFTPYAKPDDPTSFVGKISRDQLRRAMAGYYGHITHVDQQINYLLEELDQHDLRQNTIVCFLADHGEMLGDHHLFRKGYPYEGSARIPMLLSGPGVAAGIVNDAAVVELGDVMPTLLELAGLPIPAGIDGLSFAPQARGEDAGFREVLHGEHTLFGQSLQWLTDGREKYVWFSGTGREQLFDLSRDPHEVADLSTDPARQDRLQRWRSRLIAQLSGREEGFTDGTRLIPGRTVHPVLSQLR
ncbi:arylsulfatase [Microlunatus elymi]|uniref:Arylsulfatase n=1 Tax=Microlunatus elymi TaxID=2596828 RepID=A0A516PY84_9ACTN|nr:arylsulfatase [Microlunatus elymi]QDP96139.1 arylsulfatase [Microlunatus elymi]